ncbi:enoyl-CoA hydratase-related protein [Bordetella genomosp. 10]|nr:enoyl-CoA hydratase-related protein [Bordetella genomosp. 10]
MPSSSEPRLHVSRQGPLALVSMDNRAKLNALTFDMWNSLPDILAGLDQDPGVRAIVLQGEGDKAFASGSDISQFEKKRSSPEDTALYNATVERAVDAVRLVSKPTIARIRGYCLGGGLALALHCDLRYATANAIFSIPAAKIGVAYNPLWLHRLAWLTGPAAAKEILYTARRYDSQTAQRIGLVNAVLEGREIDDLLDRICELAPLTHIASKLAIDQACSVKGMDVSVCRDAVDLCFGSSDYIEGRKAFAEKRPPRFTGS